MGRIKIILAIFIIFAAYVYADIEQAKTNALFISSTLSGKGYEFRDFDSEYGGTLKTGESDYFTANFFKGLDYAIIIGGSNDSKQISVYVYDENWKEIGRSPEKSSVALEFTPKWTGTFYIKIVMVAAKTEEGADWVQLIGYKGKKKSEK